MQGASRDDQVCSQFRRHPRGLSNIRRDTRAESRAWRNPSRWCHRLVAAIITLLLVLVAGTRPVIAEGSAELGVILHMKSTTPLFVDILQAGETIMWTGSGSVSVIDPDGLTVATLAPGQAYVTSRGGAFQITLSGDQNSGWDVTVTEVSGLPTVGRLWSTRWSIETDGYGMPHTANVGMYALVPGGDTNHTAVIELRLEGLAGGAWELGASGIGADDAHAGRSVSVTASTFTPEISIYVNPPEQASYHHLVPAISNVGVDPALLQFSFDSNIDGTAHLICDFDGDGIFDLTAPDDRLVIDNAIVGPNVIPWGGRDNSGELVPAGTYECVIFLLVGEVHFVLSDAETSFPGLRLFDVGDAGSRSPLTMFWNDMLVQSSALVMPNGDVGAERSGPLGVQSGDYLAPASPHGETFSGNARAWGAFTDAGGKGDNSRLNTFTWLDAHGSGILTFDFDPLAMAIFADDFESGNAGAWSAYVP